MWRAAIWFFSGMILSALPVNALSVYVFHDVDKDMIGQWHVAYVQLNIELLIVSLIASGLLLLFICLGEKLFHHPILSLNIRLAFILGVSTIVLQYVCEMAARLWAPQITTIILAVYPFLSAALAAIMLVRNGARLPSSAIGR
jgi:hypothetical protein